MNFITAQEYDFYQRLVVQLSEHADEMTAWERDFSGNMIDLYESIWMDADDQWRDTIDQPHVWTLKQRESIKELLESREAYKGNLKPWERIK